MSSYKITPTSKNLFKSTIAVLLLQCLLWFIIINKSAATNVSSGNNIRIRGLNSVSVKEKQFDCNYHSNTICKCPGICMTQYNNESYCVLKKCFHWDTDENECKGSGKDHTAPLVLNAIPITSQLGIGYGIIERWDLFAMQLSITMGPCILLCFITCCLIGSDTNSDKTQTSGLCLSHCVSCLWVIAILIFYVFAIVWTATPDALLDGTGCHLTGFNN